MASGRKGAKPVEKAASSSGSGDVVATVRALAKVLDDHGLSELIVALPASTITLRRGGTLVTTVAAPVQHAMPAAPHYTSASSGLGGHGRAPEPAVAPDDRSHVVTSPFVGTFYRRPNPDSAEYCRLNDRVEKGAVLCIVEAMKLMNEIEADVSGTVVGVLAEDGSVVEFGQPLFKILPG